MESASHHVLNATLLLSSKPRSPSQRGFEALETKETDDATHGQSRMWPEAPCSPEIMV